MVELVMEDAKRLGATAEEGSGREAVKAIWWKNTQETFGHFGFTQGTGLQSMEDMCRNITDVLSADGCHSQRPDQRQADMWYYDSIMKKLFDNSWHPGFGQRVRAGGAKAAGPQGRRVGKLKPVGTLQVPRLVFARGTAKLTDASEATLADLTEETEDVAAILPRRQGPRRFGRRRGGQPEAGQRPGRRRLWTGWSRTAWTATASGPTRTSRTARRRWPSFWASNPTERASMKDLNKKSCSN
jgi:hypothetical protein